MANILAFDTATNACSAALVYEGQVVSECQIAPRQHDKLLLLMIESLLKRCCCTLSSLDVIAFGAGPGSFMGTRLALGMAQGLAFGANLTVLPISTLRVLAQSVKVEPGDYLLSGWDARMESIYWGEYQLSETGVVMTALADTLSSPSAIALNESTRYTAVGNAWSVYGESLPKSTLDCITDMKTDIYPEALAMIPIAQYEFSANQAIDPIHAHPHYLRNQVVHTNVSGK